MLKGTIYITYDLNLCLANLNTCKNIVVADEPDKFNIPGKIGGSLLLPPYDALAAAIDNDEEKFMYEYMNYLSCDSTVNKFINIILQALIVGTNIIILLDREGPKFDNILKQYFMMTYGIIIGDQSTQFAFDIRYFPSILNKLYADDDITYEYYLKLLPLDFPFDNFILSKMIYDSGIMFTDTKTAVNHFKKMSKIMKNGGLVKDVIKRI